MFDTYKVYSKTGCPLLHKSYPSVNSWQNYHSLSTNLDRDFTRAEFYEEFGTGSTFPKS